MDGHDGRATARQAPPDGCSRAPGPPGVTGDGSVTVEGHHADIGAGGEGEKRGLTREVLLAGVGSLLLAVFMTWPALRDPAHTIPHEIGDPALQAWQMAWSGHILTTDPTMLWQADTSYPERYSFAFSDTLLGYAPVGMIGHGPVAAVVRYNIMYVLVQAGASFGAYALLRQLGAGRAGSSLAAVAFAYAPWRLAQAGHLQVLSTGGIALALAMLARGHAWSLRYGYRPQRSNAGWALAGWLVAAWQLTLGFGIGLPFAYLLLGVMLAVAVSRAWRALLRSAQPPFPRRLAVADAAGGLLFVGVGLFMAFPYFQVAEIYPQARQPVHTVEVFSPGVEGFLIAPADSLLWGGLHASARATLGWPTESTLLPGFTLIILAVVGMFSSVWTIRARRWLFAGTVLTVVLGIGTHFFGGRPGYLTLYDHLPGWDGLRTPGRLVLWTTLLLGVLAAGAISALVAHVAESAAGAGGAADAKRTAWWRRLAAAGPLALVLFEGLNITPHPVVPTRPAALRTAGAPVLVLPSSYAADEKVMLWSTERFQPVVNGVSSFALPRRERIRDLTQTFPDAASVAALRELGVTSVVVLRNQVAGTPWEGVLDTPPASLTGLGVTRDDHGDAVVFHLQTPG
jgi:hypothetical protein